VQEGTAVCCTIYIATLYRITGPIAIILLFVSDIGKPRS